VADDNPAPGSSGPEVSTLQEARREIHGLIGEARLLAETELAYWKARARYSASHAGRSAAFGGMALIAFICTVFALIVGLLMIAAHWLGPVWATVVVTGSFFVVAAVCAFIARRHALLLKFQDKAAGGQK